MAPAELRPDERNVAVGIASTGPFGTIALEECDRRRGAAAFWQAAAGFTRLRPSRPFAARRLLAAKGIASRRHIDRARPGSVRI